MRPLCKTHYHEETPDDLRLVLEGMIGSRHRRWFHYGDGVTGRDWLGELGCVGRLSRSGGSQPILIITHNARSMGGCALLERCVVRIRSCSNSTGYIWQHPNYHHPAMTLREHRLNKHGHRVHVLADGEEHAAFANLKAAHRWLKKMGLELEHDVVLRRLREVNTLGFTS